MEGKFSQPFCVALALARGRVSEREFVEETVSDPILRDLVAKTTVEAVPALRYPEAAIEVVLEDGSTCGEKIDTETMALPLEVLQTSLCEKFAGLVCQNKPGARMDSLLERLLELEVTESVGDLLPLLPNMSRQAEDSVEQEAWIS